MKRLKMWVNAYNQNHGTKYRVGQQFPSHVARVIAEAERQMVKLEFEQRQESRYTPAGISEISENDIPF